MKGNSETPEASQSISYGAVIGAIGLFDSIEIVINTFDPGTDDYESEPEEEKGITFYSICSIAFFFLS